MGFLTPEPVLFFAQAKGFPLFGSAHLASLALSLVLVAACVLGYLRLPEDGLKGPASPRRTTLLWLSGSAVALIAGKCILYLALGLFHPLFWPLHICNLCEFVSLGYALVPNTRLGARLGDLLFCWGLTGCPSALLFPGWHSYCPALSLASICGFAEHALVFACALCVVVGKDYVPRPGRVWFVMLATALLGMVFRMVNPHLGTNFFFVTNPAGAGGPFPWLLATFGDPGFLVAYFVLAACFWALVYGVYACIAGIRSLP